MSTSTTEQEAEMKVREPGYYDRLEQEHGLMARRAAESADTLTALEEEGSLSFSQALLLAHGSAYRSGVQSGR